MIKYCEIEQSKNAKELAKAAKIEEALKLDIKYLKTSNDLMQSGLDSTRIIFNELRQQAIDLKIELELFQDIAKGLWQLLDNIENARSCEINRAFYDYVMRNARERLGYLKKDRENLVPTEH